MNPLHDALRELADEVDAAPDGLAERAWTTGRGDRQRERRTRVVAMITAAAAAVLVLWVAIMSGLGRSDTAPAVPDPDDAPQVVTGYPQRVVDPGEVEPLPAKGVPLTAVIHSRARPDGGGWLALRPDGSLFSLPGLLPGRVVADEGAAAEDLVPEPALDPTGRWLAAFEQSTGDSPDHLVITDLVTGSQRHAATIPAVRHGISGKPVEACVPKARAQLRWRPSGKPRVALACTGSVGREVVVLDTEARLTAKVSLEGELGRSTCARGLAGWVDEYRLLDVRICTGASPEGERMDLIAADTRSRSSSRVATKRSDTQMGLLQGIVQDERHLLLHPSRTGAMLSVASNSSADRQRWAVTPDITSDAPLVDDRTHAASVPLPETGAGHPNRLSDARDVTIWADGELGVMSIDTGTAAPKTLMVLNPGLQVDAVSFAETAISGDVTRHHLGARTSWWSWHPGAAALITLTVLVVLAVGLAGLWRWRHWPSVPGRARLALALVVGVVSAGLLVVTAVTAVEEPDPLPSPRVTVE